MLAGLYQSPHLDPGPLSAEESEASFMLAKGVGSRPIARLELGLGVSAVLSSTFRENTHTHTKLSDAHRPVCVCVYVQIHMCVCLCV